MVVSVTESIEEIKIEMFTFVAFSEPESSNVNGQVRPNKVTPPQGRIRLS